MSTFIYSIISLYNIVDTAPVRLTRLLGSNIPKVWCKARKASLGADLARRNRSLDGSYQMGVQEKFTQKAVPWTPRRPLFLYRQPETEGSDNRTGGFRRFPAEVPPRVLWMGQSR